MLFAKRKPDMPSAETALAGRATAVSVPSAHFVNGNPMQGPWPNHLREAVFGLGCFWGAERLFWVLPGVYSTSVGYSGGFTPNPTYEEVCSGLTGHTEAVSVIYDPKLISYATLLQTFWESHNPTQGMRQGNDTGTQYRSAIYTFDDEQAALVDASKHDYQKQLSDAGHPSITTEIAPIGTYYFAEDYHQQYLAKNPNGYCGIGGTGVSCPIPAAKSTGASA